MREGTNLLVQGAPIAVSAESMSAEVPSRNPVSGMPVFTPIAPPPGKGR